MSTRLIRVSSDHLICESSLRPFHLGFSFKSIAFAYFDCFYHGFGSDEQHKSKLKDGTYRSTNETVIVKSIILLLQFFPYCTPLFDVVIDFSPLSPPLLFFSTPFRCQKAPLKTFHTVYTTFSKLIQDTFCIITTFNIDAHKCNYY